LRTCFLPELRLFSCTQSRSAAAATAVAAGGGGSGGRMN
jgi:hypothetical protein